MIWQRQGRSWKSCNGPHTTRAAGTNRCPSLLHPLKSKWWQRLTPIGSMWQRAVAAHGQLSKGWFSRNGKPFRFGTSDGTVVGEAGSKNCAAYTASCKEGGPTVTLVWCGNVLLGVESSQPLRLSNAPEIGRRGTTKHTSWAPDQIRLPRDKRGGLAPRLPMERWWTGGSVGAQLNET